ncbi:adenosylcobinamide-GDP ribazoletransferase [Candidatus Hecatella orcuttiae]|jgi:adenosylcobinamide-GDP ribazoletransferase|uniref:adenosylcobinamide-GDP ribazoletransferase n=1 Tax=Candidatus Hecatella orcuttiae TaxID=1935119 RepID=UPI002867B32C|nr:adenosylcobinamide-GDP ribazoletransferase [Candidatus Hecatella orcuttiae]
MEWLKAIRDIFGFFTVIPVKTDSQSLNRTASYMFLSPLAGGFIGLSAGLLAWALFHAIPPLLVGMVTMGFILLLTGLHHTDGLLDFGDGLMAQGSWERKLQVMHDRQTGTGGLVLGLVVILITAFAISELGLEALRGLVAAEVSAKLSMVVGTWAGRPAHEGLSSLFIKAMHGRGRKLRLAGGLLLSSGIAFPLLGGRGLLLLAAGIITALVLVAVSNRNFGGITGDVLGASNDLARMTSLLTFLVVTPWI